jgi:hypothetical protein
MKKISFLKFGEALENAKVSEIKVLVRAPWIKINDGDFKIDLQKTKHWRIGGSCIEGKPPVIWVHNVSSEGWQENSEGLDSIDVLSEDWIDISEWGLVKN